jgi:Ca2+/Na+ antiporter
LRFDLPAMTAASLVLWLLAHDGSLTRVEGTILCLGGAAYTAGVIWTSRRESPPAGADDESPSERRPVLRVLTLLAGIGLVLLGSSVYNIALILGIAVLVAPAEVEFPREAIAADLLVLAVVGVITVPVLLTGHRISRVEGGAFVAAYAGYLVWLTLD